MTRFTYFKNSKWILSVFILGLSSSALFGLPQKTPLDQRIDNAIDWGTAYLLQEVNKGEGWAPVNEYPMGYIAIQLYALLKNDVSYLDPRVQEGINLLMGFPNKKVYSVSLAMMAYDAIAEQIYEDTKNRKGGTLNFINQDGKKANSVISLSIAKSKMKVCLRWLLKAKKNGRAVWGYDMPGRSKTDPASLYDHSNSQFAILAIGLANKRKLGVPKKFWEEVADHFIFAQEATGQAFTERAKFRSPSLPTKKSKSLTSKKVKKSKTVLVSPWEAIYRDEEILTRGWGYTEYKPDTQTTFSMTCAGQSSLLLAYKFLGLRGAGATKRSKTITKAIRDGHGWIHRYLKEKVWPDRSPYSLYSLEKVGDIGDVETYGDIDWYARGAEVLLRTQGAQGNWAAHGTPESRHQTALSLLYLGRASGFAPKSMVRLTGGKIQQNDFAQRYWVYSPSLKGQVPIIRFFRQLRSRPYGELVLAAKEVVQNYEPTQLNEMVYFIRTLQHSPFKKIQGYQLSLFSELTGEEIKKPKEALDWAKRWEEANKILDTKNQSRLDDVITFLKEANGLKMKLRLIRVLQKLKDDRAVEALFDQMESSEEVIRRTAYDAVILLTGNTLEFTPEGSGKDRKAQLEAWRKMWQVHKDQN